MLVKVKVKVKLSLFLIKHHATKTYGEVEVHLQVFLTSALDGGEWSASRPGRFTTRENVPSIHWTGGWVYSIVGLDAVAKRKIPAPAENQTSVVQPVALLMINELSR
jgi:hypothetical protein